MIGESPAFRHAMAQIAKVAAFEASVLIEGETGTGKELAARAIHYCGARRDRPFVPVNCGALPDTLIENELFGHRRGSFTDARDHQLGLVCLARGGTLFLDEVDVLSPKAQVTLLRFLQDQLFRPLGGREEQANVRIIAASNRYLDAQVEAGAFRMDLLYRLKLLHLVLPPLRERHGDPALLAEHFVRGASARFGKPVLPIDAASLSWFERYRWPGNVRELEHLIVRNFLLSDGSQISIAPPKSGLAPLGGQLGGVKSFRQAKSQAITEFEMQFLSCLLARTNGNVSAAARLSGTERRYLGRLLKKYSLKTSQSSHA